MEVTERPALSCNLIAETALKITAVDGLESLSMRKLGAALGIEAMSLYHYIDNKEQLLDAMADRLYDDLDLPDDNQADRWEDNFGRALRSLYGILVRHPAALELLTTRATNSAQAARVYTWVYRRCAALGLSPEQASVALRFSTAFVFGHVANEVGMMARFADGRQLDVEVQDEGLNEFLTYNDKISSSIMFELGLDMLFVSLAGTFDLPGPRMRPWLAGAVDGSA